MSVGRIVFFAGLFGSVYWGVKANPDTIIQHVFIAVKNDFH